MLFELWTADDKTLISEFVACSIEQAISFINITTFTIHFVKNIGE